MMVEKVDTGNFLTAQFVRDNRLTSLIIKDEGKMVTFDLKCKTVEKISLTVDYRGRRSGDPDGWTLNNKSRNALIDIFGPDTAKWVGKEVEIKLEGSGEYEHVMVDTMRTK